MGTWKRRWGLILVGTLVVAGGVWALLPKPVAVEVGHITRGPLEVSVLEDGMTRIRERYEVAAPVAGQLLRVEVHAGDLVQEGTPLVRLTLSPLDPKQEAQLTARLRSAERAAREAVALMRASEDAAKRARREAERIRRLAAESIASRDALESALTNESVTARDRDAAHFRAQATAYDVDVARAALGNFTGGSEVLVRAPVAGRVLQVLHESETIVSAGTPLILIGDPSSLEVVADFLSTDAVRIAPGQTVRIERWGGSTPLRARVRLVEPAAFTKMSALGVEEQRVNVICDLLEAAPSLGDQYRVDVRVILWSGDVATVPATALFTTAKGWSAFVVRAGRARLQPVSVGHMSETEVEITGGLKSDETLIVHPSDQIAEGVRVAARR